jgi:hypothetical protein
LSGRILNLLDDDPCHLAAHLLEGDVEGVQDTRGNAFFRTPKAEQQVFAAQMAVPESARLVARIRDDGARRGGEAPAQRPAGPLARGPAGTV